MAPSLRPYPSLDDVMERARQAGVASTYGTSVEGRELVAVRVGDGPAVAMVTAGIHGLEYIGVQAALTLLEAGPLPGVELWVCPVLNPDAYQRTWDTLGHAPVAALRKNARGVDLNRNFPLPFGARPRLGRLAGSPVPTDATYRGPEPLSEPETRHLAELLRRIRPRAAVNFHSFMGTLICARVWERADWRGYAHHCAAFREAQAGPHYPRLGSRVLDVFTGELEDWQHHVLSCWATCVECFSVRESLGQHWNAPTNFWRFNPRDPEPVAHRDAAGAGAMLLSMVRMDRPEARPRAQQTLAHW